LNIFVTGTDTDAGKTIISSWICVHTKAKYWKPIQTGNDSDSQIVKELSPKTKIIPNAYQLKVPLSPFDSANLDNSKIDINKLTENKYDKIVIEGAGGALVPISENFYMADLIKSSNSKVVIVAKSKLGFLNHIFLTVESLKARDIGILGIIVNGEVEKFLIETIEKFSALKVLQVMPYMENIKAQLKNIELPKNIMEILQ
jgi:dethiobiotin synthetase